MRLHAIAAGLVMLAASVVLVTTLWQEPESIDGGTPASAATGVIRAEIRRSAAEPDRGVQPVGPPAEPQWGRAQITGDPEHWPPNRADWSDEPERWELRPVADVPEIPLPVRHALESLDCRIPRSRPDPVNSSVIRGEFERPGQIDLAVLCVHTDQTSSTYMFWAADPARREVLPQSGNAINRDSRASVERRLDPDSPREPDMPESVDHDGLEIGCCECCSTIYYRHGGKWFTLPGAD